VCTTWYLDSQGLHGTNAGSTPDVQHHLCFALPLPFPSSGEAPAQSRCWQESEIDTFALSKNLDIPLHAYIMAAKHLNLTKVQI
jgi:hypothetical protein